MTEQYYKPCIVVIENDIAVVAWLYSLQNLNGPFIPWNNFEVAFEWLISPEGPYHKSQVVWAGDYGGIEKGYDENLYSLCTDEKHANNVPKDPKYYPLIVNHTKRIYINKCEVECEIHPLQLLTTETESRDDYEGTINENLIGIWSRDVISVENEAPEGFVKVPYRFGEE